MHHLTVPEIKILLAATPATKRRRLMLLVGFSHGLRVTELISLIKEDIRDGYVNCKRLKGSLPTIQAFTTSQDPDLDESIGLLELYKTLKTGERLFPMSRSGVDRLMKRVGTRVGLPLHKLHPHILKHSCAMACIKIAGIEYVREHLGHKTISSTGEYLRVSNEAASNAIKGAW